jgi:hypothetical protein
LEPHRTLQLQSACNPVPLAGRRGYLSAYARAILPAGGKVTGTHGARGRAARDNYAAEYRNAVGAGLAPNAAAHEAAGNVVEALGNSRHRRDHRSWYLGR